jgi:hypothetical protein
MIEENNGYGTRRHSVQASSNGFRKNILTRRNYFLDYSDRLGALAQSVQPLRRNVLVLRRAPDGSKALANGQK